MSLTQISLDPFQQMSLRQMSLGQISLEKMSLGRLLDKWPPGIQKDVLLLGKNRGDTPGRRSKLIICVYRLCWQMELIVILMKEGMGGGGNTGQGGRFDGNTGQEWRRL